MIKVLFLGNHTVGVRVLEVLKTQVSLIGVIAHPKDPEDGTAYESVFDWCINNNINVIRATGKSDQARDFIKKLKPELIYIADYKYIIPKNLWSLPALGTINLHPSLLPKYRGRASINWAIINGETKLGLTAHFVNDGVDTGDIITQKSYHLSQNENVKDALNKLYPLYQEITLNLVDQIKSNSISAIKQVEKKSTIFPRRTPQDGEINWNKSALEIHNLIRAVAPPYPGAFSEALTITKSKLTNSNIDYTKTKPGTIIKRDKEIHIMCKDRPIVITEFNINGPAPTLNYILTSSLK